MADDWVGLQWQKLGFLVAHLGLQPWYLVNTQPAAGAMSPQHAPAAVGQQQRWDASPASAAGENVAKAQLQAAATPQQQGANPVPQQRPGLQHHAAASPVRTGDIQLAVTVSVPWQAGGSTWQATVELQLLNTGGHHMLHPVGSFNSTGLRRVADELLTLCV